VRSSPVLARLILGVGRLTSRLPMAWSRRFGRTAGAALARGPSTLRKVVELNLRLCFPDMSDRDRVLLSRRALAENAATMVELASVWRWPMARLERLDDGVEGRPLYREAAASGRGVLLLVPHLGNWEFLNVVLARHSRPVALYRPPRIAELDGFIRRARERTGALMVPATPGGLRPILRALRSGGTVVILPDQEPLRAHGVHAPFFGVPALTMTLVAQILRRTGSEPLFASCERTAAGFRTRFRPPPEGLDDADDVAAAASLNRGVEACVRELPEQYLWTYKRFLTAPPGEPTPYRAIWSRRRLRRHPWPPPDRSPAGGG
jgi:KDO2-lipid IV(A) lauroyltransferase